MWGTQTQVFKNGSKYPHTKEIERKTYNIFLGCSLAFGHFASIGLGSNFTENRTKKQGKQIIYLQSTLHTGRVFKEKYILCATLHETLMGLQLTVWSTKDYFMHIIDQINWMRPISLIT